MPQEDVSQAFIKRLRLKGFPQKPLEMKRWVNAHISMLAKQFDVAIEYGSDVEFT